jgi:hypothetical protein
MPSRPKTTAMGRSHNSTYRRAAASLLMSRCVEIPMTGSTAGIAFRNGSTRLAGEKLDREAVCLALLQALLTCILRHAAPFPLATLSRRD